MCLSEYLKRKRYNFFFSNKHFYSLCVLEIPLLFLVQLLNRRFRLTSKARDSKFTKENMSQRYA